ncbi:MAG TPA: hypothetical protein VM802_10165 [Chitinophaga sp.]|uniref:hypothetical protein n=1 Tax=Chitinophaga sp. TaxID=1869181 RepID=UPI002C5B9C8F|nr:hypothetical protein [Chitinophaga sp.]HVI45227.1 hypothetical protein [Chitinophaga sp.]
MKQFFQQLFRDKNGTYSLREVAVGLLLMVLLVSWIAQQFYGKDLPEFMFFSFSSLVAAGCFGYSMERRQ